MSQIRKVKQRKETGLEQCADGVVWRRACVHLHREGRVSHVSVFGEMTRKMRCRCRTTHECAVREMDDQVMVDAQEKKNQQANIDVITCL